MNIQKAPTLGAGLTDLFNPLTNLLSPHPGRVIETAGTPAALSFGVVAVLAGAVVLIAGLKKRRLL